MTEAQHQLAFGCDPYAIAAAAEIVAVRRDEADLRLRARHLPVARRPTGDMAAAHQRMPLFDALAHLIAGTESDPALVAGHVAQRHLFDEADIESSRHGEIDQIKHLVVIAAFLDHAVELDALEASSLRRIDAFKHAFEAVTPSQLGEALRIQRIEADVQTAHACAAQGGRQLVKLRTVGGDGQVFQFAACAKAFEQLGQTLADQRLATGDADALDAQPDEGIGDGVELFKRKDVRARREDHVLAHAVGAAKVATVGNRKPQVCDAPTERVDQLRIGHLSLPLHA